MYSRPLAPDTHTGWETLVKMAPAHADRTVQGKNGYCRSIPWAGKLKIEIETYILTERFALLTDDQRAFHSEPSI